MTTKTESRGVCARISPNLLCTLTYTETKYCINDLGAPLVSGNKLIGVGLSQSKCADGFPETFARISKYYQWIHDTIKNK